MATAGDPPPRRSTPRDPARGWRPPSNPKWPIPAPVDDLAGEGAGHAGGSSTATSVLEQPLPSRAHPRSGIFPDSSVPARVRSFPYNPSLDGVRAIAVLAVLLYHGSVQWFSGGFLGVDLFFVLSGYLITTLLLLEHEQSGRIALKEFWMRRARRLLPALFVVLGWVAVYAWFFADSAQLATLRRHGLSTLFYVANWSFIFGQESYFEQYADPSPLRHTWSLGIEEQWYLFWPIIVVLALKFTKGRTNSLALPVVGLAAWSALLMVFLFEPGEDPSRVYYGTDTRAQALLIGAALAFLLHRIPVSELTARILQVTGIAGFVGCIAMFHFVDDAQEWMFRGGFLLMAVFAASVITVCARGEQSIVKQILAYEPLPAIGRISYGLYLYHWPVFIFLDEERTGLDGLPLLVVRFVLTFAISYASYRFLEKPIRDRRMPFELRRIVPAAATVGLVLLLVVATSEISPNFEATAESGKVRGSGSLAVTVVGDSVAAGLAEEYDPEKTGGDLAVLDAGLVGCGVTSGEPKPEKVRANQEDFVCDQMIKVWKNSLALVPADAVVVVTGGHEVFDQEVDGEVIEFGTPEFRQFLFEEFGTAADVLGSTGADVVFMNVPCMYEELKGIPHEERRDPQRVEWLNGVLDDFAASRPDVTLVDANFFLCPTGTYQPELDGVEIYKDGIHYTHEGADVLWTWLAPQLHQAAAAP